MVRLLSAMTICFALAACGGGGGGGGGGGDEDSGSGSANLTDDSAQTSTDSADETDSESPSAPPPPTGEADGADDPSTVTLSWTPPSTRENGEPLTMSEITGYEIYYYSDTDPDNGQTVPVDGGATTSYIVTVPGPGTYYFAMSAVDTNGLTSDNSNFVSVTVQ